MSIWDVVPLGIVKWFARRIGVPVRLFIGDTGPFYADGLAGILVRVIPIRNNRKAAKTVGEFLTYAIYHITHTGKVACCDVFLPDGVPVRLTLARIETTDEETK